MLTEIWAFVLPLMFSFYFWYTSKYKYFKERGLVGPQPSFPFGNTPGFIMHKRNVIYDVDNIYRQFKATENFVGYFEMKTPKIMLIDPQSIKSMLKENSINFNGNDLLLSDSVSSKKESLLDIDECLKASFPSVHEVVKKFSHYINEQINQFPSKPLEAFEISTKYTIDASSSYLFDIDAQSFTNENSDIRKMIKKMMNFNPIKKIFHKVCSSIKGLGRIENIKLRSKIVQAFFTNLMKQAIQRRKKSKTKINDFLSYLTNLRNIKNISDWEITSYGLSFLVDSHETSSTTLAHALYELGFNKNVQDKLRASLADIFDEEGNIDYSKMVESSYLDQVFYETLRLHPSKTILTQKLTKPFTLHGEKGRKLEIEEGRRVTIPIYSIHRDKVYYPEPRKFLPERFNPLNGGVNDFVSRGVFFPFGDNQNTSLKMKFAEIQIKAAIAVIIRNFDIKVNVKTQNPVVIEPTETSNIKAGGLWLNFKNILS